ncbi:dnaJ homolog subfamily C member 14-like [Chenopodium quinoa]|uniref:dnaJ homolog subfamily C member 14-like n=1 Tax=Chenopodium quinoa TaxID=63459 RepID=UPI000B77576C|nr:dnaJ homolog subfamily C member 14-like [Chenopodium quinoa]
MARRGNQPKRGIDQTSSKSKKKDPDVKGFVDELLSGEHLNSPLTDCASRTSVAGDGRKKNKKSKNVSKKSELKVDGVEVGSSVPDNSVSGESMEKLPRDFNTSHVSNNSSGNHDGADNHRVNGSFIAGRTDKLGIFRMMVLENLRHYALSILRISRGWLERKQPVFAAVVRNVYKFRKYIQLKLVHTYPIVLKWLFHLGNILLLVSMVWLDCAFRGMDSFLRMGTTSFFSILWFSILSIIAMIGMFKFLLVLAFAALIGVLVGYIISLLVIVIAGGVFLWIYGSFWTTSVVIILAGLAFILSCERISLSILTVYSVYCAWAYVGWLGVLLGFNLSFISSDALIYFLKNNIDERRSKSSERADGVQGDRSYFNGEAQFQYSDVGSRKSMDRNAGVASTSGADSEISSEDEVVRLLNCTDHYSALGLSRYQQVDESVLKKEYRKKAMLVHPDKNMGNEKAAEAFKKLQNAYEVLLDSLKRKAYDDELRKEELLSYFCRFQGSSQKSGRHGLFPNGFARSEGDGKDPLGEARRIACKKCGSFHIWFQTKKSKLKARWCQDCEELHQAKDGDGWVEQSSQPLLFGILRKVDVPVAYVCADGRVYDATEWYICQGMRCPANSHKPSFHVNTSITKNSFGKGSSTSHRGGGVEAAAANMEENMTEEEFFEWLQNAMQTGMFENFNGVNLNESSQSSTKNDTKTGSANTSGGGSASSSRKKKKGKKPW